MPSRLVSRVSALRRRMIETCGPRQELLFKSSDPALSFSKTFPVYSLTNTPLLYSGTLLKTATRHYRRLNLGLMTLVPITGASGYGLWPTPQAQDCKQHGNREHSKAFMLIQAVKMFPTPYGLSANQGQGDGEFGKAIRNWQTPSVSDAKAGSKKDWLDWQERGKTVHCRLRNQVRMWPTMTAQDASGHRGTYPKTKTHNPGTTLPTAIGGQLNPTWVEWLMGWPLGWTDLKPLGMDKFRRWWRQFGGC